MADHYSALARRRLLRTVSVLVLMLPVLLLVLAAIWSDGHDLARHEQYAATAAAWAFWLMITGLMVDVARDVR